MARESGIGSGANFVVSTGGVEPDGYGSA